MKLLLIYRLTLGTVLTVILPLTLLASSGLGLDKPVKRELASAVLPMFQDTTASSKKNSDKPRETQKKHHDEQEERLNEAQRRAIKQVPRSIPKLKPQPVTERPKINRPPMKVPKKGMGNF